MSSLDDRFPKKRISAGALIRNGAGELLIVKPNYRDGWLLPGGIVEAGESPQRALLREVEEELNLRLRAPRLRCVDYLRASGDYGESLHLLFACTAPSEAELAQLRMDADELDEWRWSAPDAAQALLVPSIAARLRTLARAAPEAVLYLENGNAAEA